MYLQCGSPFTAADIVIINGTEEDFKRQNEAMIERRVLAKQAKLAKVRDTLYVSDHSQPTDSCPLRGLGYF